MDSPRVLAPLSLLLPLATQAQEAGMMCCEALVAECMACLAGISTAEFCATSPEYSGCEGLVSFEDNDGEDLADDPVMCCFAYSAECLSCADGMEEIEWCKTHENVPGCEEAAHLNDSDLNGVPDGATDIPLDELEHPCCKAFTAECNSCMSGESIGAYCQMHPSVKECPEWLAFSKDSLAAESRRRIDLWLAQASKHGVNEFGDDASMMYLGGSPLFDESTGAMMDLYYYVAMMHDDAPWMTDVDDAASTLGLMPPKSDVDGMEDGDSLDDGEESSSTLLAVVWGVGGAVFAGAVLTAYSINRSKNQKHKGIHQLDSDNKLADSSGSAGEEKMNEMMEIGDAAGISSRLIV